MILQILRRLVFCLIFKSNLINKHYQNNYNIQRGNYNSLDESHISYFRNLLGDDRLVMDLSDLEKYNIDWMNHLRGTPIF